VLCLVPVSKTLVCETSQLQVLVTQDNASFELVAQGGLRSSFAKMRADPRIR
jgi:hypothetical protein